MKDNAKLIVVATAAFLIGDLYGVEKANKKLKWISWTNKKLDRQLDASRKENESLRVLVEDLRHGNDPEEAVKRHNTDATFYKIMYREFWTKEKGP